MPTTKPQGPLTADHRGFEAVIGLFARSYEMANGTLSYEANDVPASVERAITLLTKRVTYVSRPVETQAVHVGQIRDGRISEVWAYNWDQYSLDDAMTEVIVRAAR
jgi:ketosteroid isomerase-like protein